MIHHSDLIPLVDNCHRLETFHSILDWMISELESNHQPVALVAEVLDMTYRAMEVELSNLTSELEQLRLSSQGELGHRTVPTNCRQISDPEAIDTAIVD